jgi:hypothetical protein
VSTAQQTLDQLFPGVPISVVESPDQLQIPQLDSCGPSRFCDTPPFYAGDEISIAGGAGASGCTSNFTFSGAIHPANIWSLTARHCGGSPGSAVTLTESGAADGNIATQYVTDGAGHTVDFQSFNCNCEDTFVWYAGTGNQAGSDYDVTGQCNCYSGNDVATDGRASGQETDWAVQGSGPGCIDNDESNTCDVEEGYNANQTVGAEGGDSGGPVYQRQGSSGDVLATGLMLASQGTTIVWYQVIDEMESLASINLY